LTTSKERTHETAIVKKLMLFAMWLAGSAAAIGVAWAGVSIVDDQVIDPAPAIGISSGAGSSAGADDGVPSPTSVPTTDGEQPTPSSPGITPEPTTTPGPTSPSATPSASPSPSETAGPTPATTSTPNATAASTVGPTTQTFVLVGGTAAVSFSPSGAEVLWATPNAGFGVTIEPESPGFKVEFRSDDHRSRIDLWWAGGPHHDIREEAH
jgi:hypothetical protein